MTITAHTDIQESPVPAPAKATAVGSEPGTPSGWLNGDNHNHLNVSRHNTLGNAPAVSKDNEVLELPNCLRVNQTRPRSSANTSGPVFYLLHPPAFLIVGGGRKEMYPELGPRAMSPGLACSSGSCGCNFYFRLYRSVGKKQKYELFRL